MRRIVDYFRGVCRLRLRGCEPERCLDALLLSGIAFWATAKPDEFTLTLHLYRSDADIACEIAQRCQCESEITVLRSFRRDFYGLKQRWALLIGLLAVLGLCILLPNFVVSVDVSGCQGLSEVQVLRALDDLGVHFGAWGPSIDSEQLRNSMLLSIPELRWVGVNWSGMQVHVQVAERTFPEKTIERRGAADLIACTDGVVRQIGVLNGQAACTPGDAVRQGQVLISGRVDLEWCTVTTRALGEVYADTLRRIQVLTPDIRLQRTPAEHAGFCLWLRVGRKRIKIFGNSGILMDGCVKMINRETMRLPGGVELPLGLCMETYRHTSTQSVPLGEADAAALLDRCAERILAERTVAGRIESSETAFTGQNGAYCLTTTAHCREMIARSAEIPLLELEQYGKTDQRGTDGTAH